jgi:hypothetical protein
MPLVHVVVVVKLSINSLGEILEVDGMCLPSKVAFMPTMVVSESWDGFGITTA